MKRLLSLAALVALLLGAAVSNAQQCAVNLDQGCANQNIESGGTVTVKSGGSIDIQSGGTITDANTNSQVLGPADTAAKCWSVANGFTCEGATADAFESTLSFEDPDADRTITVKNADGAVNVGFVQDVLFCGQLPNNTTNYMSPVSGYAGGALYAAGTVANDLSYAIGGTGCDAEDNATEATADEVLYANNAVKVLGMYCAVSGSGSNGVTINLRDDTASLTPDVTVTIPTTETTAATATSTTTDIAAGSAVAIRAITTEDLSLQDAWCIARMLIVP